MTIFRNPVRYGETPTWANFKWWIIGSFLLWAFIAYCSYKFVSGVVWPAVFGAPEEPGNHYIDPALLDQQRAQVQVDSIVVNQQAQVIRKYKPEVKYDAQPGYVRLPQEKRKGATEKRPQTMLEKLMAGPG